MTGDLRMFQLMTRSGAILLLVIFALIVLSGCASKPKIFSNADSSVDFSQFKTYSFFPELATDKPGYESLETTFLKVAVAQEMDQRGFTYSNEADLLLNFNINTEEKIRSRSVPTGGAYYGYRDPFYDPWGGYAATETRIEQYTLGTLNIDAVDVSTNKLVWEGSIVGKITDDTIKNLEAVIDEAVKEVFGAFPVQPPAAQ
jgi:hypothetical protein